MAVAFGFAPRQRIASRAGAHGGRAAALGARAVGYPVWRAAPADQLAAPALRDRLLLGSPLCQLWQPAGAGRGSRARGVRATPGGCARGARERELRARPRVRCRRAGALSGEVHARRACAGAHPDPRAVERSYLPRLVPGPMMRPTCTARPIMQPMARLRMLRLVMWHMASVRQYGA
eukprot:3792974-Prymnesium_polylepis.2